jgi:UDP-N-acetylglucosamine 2-epimerase
MAPLEAILAALQNKPGPTLFTAPNADPGGDAMKEKIRRFVRDHAWSVYRDTLGSRLYANAMRHATVMVGNSSSGIIEAAVFGLNVINVGGRQDGRLRGSNVHDVPSDEKKIGRLLDALTVPATGSPSHSLYGDGHAGRRIAAVIVKLPDRRQLVYKRFHEQPATFHAPWHEKAGGAYGRD